MDKPKVYFAYYNDVGCVALWMHKDDIMGWYINGPDDISLEMELEHGSNCGWQASRYADIYYNLVYNDIIQSIDTR